MWHITSGANYRLTGNRKSRNRALLAAMTLSSRYNALGGYFRCWNDCDEVNKAGWTIIDSMMNLPLLYWASNEVKDERFRNIAIKQADMSMKDHLREDGAINHIVVHDTNKEGVVLEVRAGQGYAVGSCWSRGDAWALYGFTLSYLYTKKDEYLQSAIKVADYFIAKTKETDWLPRVDFCQPDSPMYYDSTAGAIAVCGILELAKILDGEKSEYYLNSAINILKAMEKNWCNWASDEDSILQMGSEAYTWGIHKPIIYGDFYFFLTY
jgi:unsaturated chondroitin disaccharide hydrolase